jgi:hypothetical protein
MQVPDDCPKCGARAQSVSILPRFDESGRVQPKPNEQPIRTDFLFLCACGESYLRTVRHDADDRRD